MLRLFVQACKSASVGTLDSLGLTLAVSVLLLSLPFPVSGQACVTPPTGLVSWWAGDGNANDEIGANTGTLLNGVTFSSGEVNQAFTLSGGSHIRVPDAPDLHFTTESIEAWVYPTMHGDYHEMVSKWNAAGGGLASYDLALHPDGRAYFLLSADGNSASAFAITTNSLPLNTWTFLVGTYDGSTIKIYMNGAFQNDVAYSGGIFPGTGDLGIGGTVGGASAGQMAYAFAGKLDEVCLYDRALSESEIQQIYSAGSFGKCNTPIAPVITSQPVGHIVHVGMQVGFQAVAIGRPLYYQWQFDHSDIAGATNNTLVLNNVQTSQAGIYSVILSNIAGIAPSSDATLEVLSTCVAASSGMVAWWPADGDATDHFADNNATLHDGLGFAPGEAGLSFSLDGLDDYVSVDTSQFSDVGAGDGLTVECWIKPADVSAPQTIAEWNSGVGDIGVHIDHSNPGIGGLKSVFADLVDINGGSHILASPPGIITTNAFQHIAVTYNRTNGVAKIYRNGIVVRSQSFGSFRPQTTFPLAFGSRVSGPYNGQFFAGLMDEVALYNRALTDSEIQAIFNAGSSGKTCIAPEVLAQPQSQRVKPGTNVTFAASVRGTAPLSYQWRLNGVDLGGATNSSLTLSNVQPNIAGNYSLKITNTLGSTISSNAILKIDVVFAFGNGQSLTNSQATFGGSVTIQLTNAYANGLIFYTLDGTSPSFASAQYMGPFLLTHNATLRALGYSADFFQSGELDPVDIHIVPTYTLTTNNAEGGGSIALSPVGGSYLSNMVVNLTATPAPGWMFLQWLGDVTGTNPASSVTMTRSKYAQAIFGTTLGATSAGNGSVSLNPPGGIYPYGTVVWLTAVPQPGSYFGIWGSAASGNVNPLSFGVTNANPTVSSLFTSLSAGQAALTVVPVGDGRISVRPRANVYTTGQSVSVTAAPDSGQSFLNWSGDASGSQNPLSILMDQSKTIYANFTHKPVLIARAGFEGLKPEGFQLTLIGDFGAQYEIEASSNLTNWSALATLTNSYGSSELLDATALNLTDRFYRARLLP